MLSLYAPVPAAGILHYTFACRQCGKRVIWWALLAYEAVLCTIVCVRLASAYDLVLQFALLAAILCLVNKLSLAVSVSVSIVSLAITWSCFGIADASLSVLLTTDFTVPLLLLAETAAGTCLNLAANAAALRLLRLAGQHKLPQTAILLIPVLFVFAASAAAAKYVYSTIQIGADAQYGDMHAVMLVLYCAGLAAVLCTLAAYSRLLQSHETALRMQSLALARQAEQAYVHEAQARLERTRSVRHDWLSHLTAVDGLLKTGKYSEATQYLSSLTQEVSETSVRAVTGCPALDVIIAAKTEAASASGVEVNVRPCVLPLNTLDDLDLCVIFANALDNAITAGALADGERRVEVRMRRLGNMLALFFSNSCLPGPLPKPGTGIGNIRHVAEKYNGSCSLEKTGSEACLKVLLCIP